MVPPYSVWRTNKWLTLKFRKIRLSAISANSWPFLRYYIELILVSFGQKAYLSLVWMPLWRIELKDVHSVRNQRSQWKKPCCGMTWMCLGRGTCWLCGTIWKSHALLILVDTHSKWMEMNPVKHATSLITIQKLWTIFATHILPACHWCSSFFPMLRLVGLTIVMPFIMSPWCLTAHCPVAWLSRLYKHLNQPWRRWHLAPWKPVAKFLPIYCLMPHSSTGCSPAKLLLDLDWKL